MLKRFVMFSLVAGAMLVAPKAEAAYITGGLSLAATPGCAGCNPVIPVDAAGNQTFLVLATGLDFTTTGALTPGVAGNFAVINTAGDFNAVFGATGKLNDFMFNAPAIPGYPNVPFLFQSITSPVGFSFTVTSVEIVVQQIGFLDLHGFGVFTLDGFDPTPGEFRWQSNSTGTVFSFAGSESAVPEPGSMILLGTGLLSLGSALRRKIAKQ